MLRTFCTRILAGLGLAACLSAPASAGVISFESAQPGTFLFGSASPGYTENGFHFDVVGDFAAIDTVAAFGPGTGLDLAAPTGNGSQFMSVLNDSAVLMWRDDGAAFRLAGVSFAYLPPLTRLFAAGEQAGLLIAQYFTSPTTSDFLTWDFGTADAAGAFSFQHVGLNAMGGASSGVVAVAFYACAYDGQGGCDLRSGGFSQFAIDDITIPEPGTAALLGLALLGGFAVRRGPRGRAA